LKNNQPIKVDITQNPGYRLRQHLATLFPNQPARNSYISKIDEVLYAESEFSELSYYSSLNYLVRRLIAAADFIERKFSGEDNPPNRYLLELRKHLRNNYSFPSSSIEDTHTLLLESLQTRGKPLSSGKINQVLKLGEAFGYSCYICGRDVIYDKTGYKADEPALAQVEHVWPKYLGGSNELYNLTIACQACNHTKENFIDYYDYHFEHFHNPLDTSHENHKFLFTKQFRQAAFLRSNCECKRCSVPAVKQTPLYFCRSDKSDTWHLLNIDTYCDKHKTE
jgi:5-methylcytosine-specific restriction endonuclease McrA